MKTQGVENKKILAVCDGYVARMTSGLYGFGNALYVVHPNGYMSVYCHLNDFVPELQKILRERQYAEESERVDVKLPPGVFPVKARTVDCIQRQHGGFVRPAPSSGTASRGRQCAG